MIEDPQRSLKKSDIRTLELRALSLLVFAASITPFVMGKMSPVILLLSWGVLFPIWFNLPFEKIRNHALWKWFTLFSFSLFILSRVIKTSWFYSIVILILFSVVYEVYGERRKTAHIRILSLLSFFILIAQFRFDQGINLFAGILLFFFGVGIALMRFRQIRLAEKLGPTWLSWKKTILPMSFLFLSMSPFCVFIFWSIPRSQNSSLQAFSLGEGNFISAFSDQVSLNDIGTISQSKKHVLDLIPLDGQLAPSSYLTGRILDHFKNGLWRSSTEWDKRLRSPKKGFINLTHNSTSALPTTRYSVSIRPLKGNPLFFFPQTSKLEIADPIYIETQNKHLYHASKFPHLIHYILHCAPQQNQQLDATEVRAYLSLEENQDYFHEKAVSIFGANLHEMGAAQKINILKQFFKDHFLYTLEINNFGESDPLHYFIETTQRGHCELFASSATLILRGAGVPTRLVTGFMLPEMINQEFYHVTEASAHAWVEVWVDNHWQTFDPTGSAALAPLSWAQQKMALLNRSWEDLIVMWDASTQLEWVHAIQAHLSAIKVSTKKLTLLAIACIAMLYWRFRPRLQLLLQTPTPLSRFEQMIYTHFSPKKPEQPWDAYISKLPIQPLLKQQIQTWVHTYFKMVFSKTSIQKKPAHRSLLRDLKSIRKAIQKGKHGKLLDS